MKSLFTENTDLQDGRGLRIAIIATWWNKDVVEPMVKAAYDRLRELLVDHQQIETLIVPGAYELPLAARKLADTRKYDAILAFGCVIRGETAHFDYVAGEAARGLMNVGLETGTPVMFGVLTTEDREQALERALPDRKNKGAEIAGDAIAYVRALQGADQES